MLWILVLLLVGIIWMLHRNFGLCNVQLDSMVPVLRPNDLLLFRRRVSNISIGDIVIFKLKPELSRLYLIKRIAKITPDCIWVLGDNEHGVDSRNFGWISRSYIYGKAIRVLVSFDTNYKISKDRLWVKL